MKKEIKHKPIKPTKKIMNPLQSDINDLFDKCNYLASLYNAMDLHANLQYEDMDKKINEIWEVLRDGQIISRFQIPGK